jgi:hypothetical protein
MQPARHPSDSVALRVGLLAALVALATVACGVGQGSNFERVPSPIPLGLDDPLPSTTTTTTTTIPDAVTTSVDEATTTTIITSELVLMYFISSGQLTGVPVPLTPGPTLFQVIARLQGGPPEGDEFVGLRSAVPATVTIEVTDDRTGIATVDLPSRFFDLIVPSEQRLAIGQIVLTLLNRPSLGQVRFTSDGEDVEVPKGSGEQADAGELLNLLDYENLLDSQPETTTTTTTTVAPALQEAVETSTSLPLEETTTTSE